MNLRLHKYGNDVGIVDSLGGAKSAARDRHKKRDIPRCDLPSKYKGIRMDEEAIAELYAGRRYDKPLRPRLVAVSWDRNAQKKQIQTGRP